VYSFSAGTPAPAEAMFFAEGPVLYARERERGPASEIASLKGVRSLRGRHNVQNALAAAATLRALDDRLAGEGGEKPLFDPVNLGRALAIFPGLKHRMEEVGTLGRVLFINDS